MCLLVLLNNPDFFSCIWVRINHKLMEEVCLRKRLNAVNAERRFGWTPLKQHPVRIAEAR